MEEEKNFFRIECTGREGQSGYPLLMNRATTRGWLYLKHLRDTEGNLNSAKPGQKIFSPKRSVLIPSMNMYLFELRFKFLLYSKRIFSASGIWPSFSSLHEKCPKTNENAFKRGRLN